MCEQSKPSIYLRLDIAALIVMANSFEREQFFSIGEAIFLWRKPDGEESWTFSYHDPAEAGRLVVDYTNTLNTFGSKLEAEIAMSQFVWAMNEGKT